MLLENKNAVIHGAGGSIGGAVAGEFAPHERAHVFLAGRNPVTGPGCRHDVKTGDRAPSMGCFSLGESLMTNVISNSRRTSLPGVEDGS